MERAVTSPAAGAAGGSAAAGFSLIELLVATAVLAVLAVGATLSLGRSAGQAESDQALFQRHVTLSADLAITGQQSQGLVIDRIGLRRVVHTLEGWQFAGPQQRWRGRVLLQTRDARAALPPVSTNTATQEAALPDLVFRANGAQSAFDITFHHDGQTGRCRSDGWTGLICER